MRLERFISDVDFKDRTPRSAVTSRVVLERLLRDTRGITVIIIAFALPVLIGLSALGIETGLWYAMKRQDQAAADAAAVSGAYERATGQTYSEICTLAK